MGGFNWEGETYTEGESGGQFVTEEEFDRLRILDAVVFATAVREGISNYDPKVPKEQWLLDFIDPEGEERCKGFTKGNPERDARFMRLKQLLAAQAPEPEPLSFTKIGRRNEICAPKGPVE